MLRLAEFATDYRYAYDRAGNITNFQGTAQRFNAANSLTGVGNASVSSDAQDNMIDWSGSASMSYSATNQQESRATPETSYQTRYDTADTTQPNRFDEQLSSGAQFAYELTQTALGVTGITRGGQGRYAISREPDGTPGPYSSEANAYNFAGNNPCNNTDRSGLDPFLDAVGSPCGRAAVDGVGLTVTVLSAAAATTAAIGGAPVTGGVSLFATGLAVAQIFNTAAQLPGVVSSARNCIRSF